MTTPSASKTTAAPGRVLLASFALAVATFVASTVVTALRLREVSDRSEDIYASAMPSILELATLRQRVHQLEDAIEATLARGHPVTALDTAIDELARSSSAIRTGREWMPREQTLWTDASAEIALVVGDAREIRKRVAANDATNPPDSIELHFRRTAAAADTELWRLVELNASEGVLWAKNIESIRGGVTTMSFGLDLSCCVISALLAVIAFRAQRRHTRLIEERSHELEQFAARVAHDLRGPLSPALFAIGRMLARPGPDDGERVLLERANRSLGRVTSLVDDLLEFARAGGEVAQGATTNLRSAVDAVLDEELPFAESRKVELVAEGIDGGSVACTPGVLTSILSNLVRNAIKYMGDAAVRRVVVRTRAAPKRDGRVLLEVEDTGPGLPEGSIGRIFDPYVRADRSGQPGLGLGLATVRRLAEAHGGAVGARSNERGCTFWVEMPEGRPP